MTTIAFHSVDKEIAFDSRCTRGELIVSDSRRKDVENDDGVIFILAGTTADCALVAEYYPFSPSKKVNAYGFAVDDGVVKWLSFDDNGINITDIDYNEAAGSGQEFALTAMDIGCSAKDAVKYAMKRDVNTGGEIRVISLGNSVNG